MNKEPRTPRLTVVDGQSDKVRQLRERYLNGTLDEVLVPEDADLSALFSAVFGDDEPPLR